MWSWYRVLTMRNLMKKALTILILTLTISGCASDSTFWQPVDFDQNRTPRSPNAWSLHPLNPNPPSEAVFYCLSQPQKIPDRGRGKKTNPAKKLHLTKGICRKYILVLLPQNIFVNNYRSPEHLHIQWPTRHSVRTMSSHFGRLLHTHWCRSDIH